jgi:hypothetical protein
VFAFLAVIPEGNLLLPCILVSHPERSNGPAFVFAFLAVIPEGNLLLPVYFGFSS